MKSKNNTNNNRYKTKHYWQEKENNKRKAIRHTEEMNKSFPTDIQNCIENSIIYGGPDATPIFNSYIETPNFEFKNIDSVSAIFTSAEINKKICVLNFASFKNPGGMFINGSSAQEEALCHESFLYNVLKEFPKYYEWNNKNTNKSMYKNRAIYSPNVKFFKGRKIQSCDVLTCACPNKGSAQKYHNVSNEKNTTEVQKRLNFIKQIAEEQKVNTLILGAFGCGVFKQDPKEIAELIKNTFSKTSIKNIILAVPGNNINSKEFKNVFG